MPDDFFSTAERMYDSSKVLHKISHFHNASYMAGYVLECYGKILLSLDPTLNPRSYGHRIININNELQYLLTNSSVIGSHRQYIIDMSHQCPNVLNTWSPHNRYADSLSSWNGTVSQNFQNEVAVCWEQIIKMNIDGII